MSFPYKAVFVDLDGTLLNTQKKISPRNLNCINSLVEQNIPVIVSTGRPIKSAKKAVGALQLNFPIITLNGSEIRAHIDSAPMFTSYLDNSIRDSIYKFCSYLSENFKIKNILADTGTSFYCLRPNHPSVDEFADHYDHSVNFLDLTNPPEDSIVCFLFLLSDDSNREEFIHAQKEILPTNVEICTFNGWPWIEIGSTHSNKGTAMHFVCEHLGIAAEDVIAFGDGGNDVHMLSQAGLGVAMANSDPHALQATQTRTLSHDEDGVSVFLEKLMMSNNNDTYASRI